ncbi:MAG: DUF5716 family protein [Treponema sp.]|jgi:hypothetical protein|nr:DUF5716 family protein [Treponema sp.]
MPYVQPHDAPQGVFSVLPDAFFSPLAWANRRHYAALLVLYYRLFQEHTRGVERELVIREFTQYLGMHRESLSDEDDADDEAADEAANAASEDADSRGDMRALAGRFLRRLVRAGWLSEETLADFTRVINITAYGKPFFEALVKVSEGLKTEYESHVVTIYSSLCGETVRENGHFMVLKAREEAAALIDSLKVLSQSIKGHYDALNAEAVRSEAAAVLHEHYDLYAGEVLDKAYKRLKTSDNVSRYRQSIFKQIAALLADEAWLDESAGKYVRMLSTSREDCRKKLVSMLEDIRDNLRVVDPLEDEIDHRNAVYSRSSTEIIKAWIEPDSTVAGKIAALIKASSDDAVREHFAHDLYRFQFLSPSSVSLRRERAEADFSGSVSDAEREAAARALAQSEADFAARRRKQLSMQKVSLWLDERGGAEKILSSGELIQDEASFVRFVYALLYGDSRKQFDYIVEDADGKTTSAGYAAPNVRFRKKERV